ncbi:FGGY-family carbohydrate kinase [Streptomyces sp. AD55]|uniref:xylulokinase n=1 Tax=Streptomyces sp. AD55 TaxID=3242895 RepID=UPI0035294A08
MMAGYIIGLDNGTTSARAKMYDTTGVVVAAATSEYGCEYPHPGWVDQDIRLLDDANFEVLRRVVETSGVDPKEIRSLGLSTQRGLHLYIDADGNVLRDGRGLSWQDARHTTQLDQLRREIGDERFYAITGLPISAFWPIGKILWVAQNEPDVLRRTSKILSTQEYFLRRLSDVPDYVVDHSNASLFGLMDVDRFVWSRELLDVVGITADLLPSIVPSGHRVGAVTPSVARRTGLPAGLPVSTGGGDQQCAGIGAGAIRPGLCELTFGTAGNSVAFLAEPVNDPHRVITRSVHATPYRAWEAEGIQAAAGAAYRWFRDNIGYMARYIEPFTRTDPYIVINALAADSPAGANGLVFHPYLAGSMTPHYDEHARAGFLGLTLKHTLGDMARAVLEGVAYEAREVLDGYDAMGLELDEIRLAGGATKSELWCQIQADVYGKPTAVLREGECAVLGAAILGAVGAGVFGNVEEGVNATVHVDRIFRPDPACHERYTELWDIYRQAYKALAESGVYRALSAAQTR